MRGRMRCVLLLAFVMPPGVPTAAADATAAQPANATQKVEQLSLEELLNISIVTAARHAQKLGDSPSTVSVITAEQIRRSGKTTLADLLKTVAGMDVSYSSERKFAVAARGLSGGTFSKRILFLVDGRPINVPSSGEAYVGYPVALNDIQQIEIIRGPGSSLYGGNAFAGVVNVITKRPEDYSRAADLLLSYGSYNRTNDALAVGRKIGGVGLAASVNYLQFDRDSLSASLGPDDFKGYDVKGRLEYKGFNAEAGYNGYKMPISEKGQYSRSSPYMRYENDRLGFGQLQWSHGLSSRVSASAKAYYNGFRIDRYDLYNFPGEVKDSSGVVRRSYAAGDRRWWKSPSDEASWGGGVQVDWATGTNNRLIAGADYLKQTATQDNLRSLDGTPDPALNYYAGKSLDAAGAFLQDELSLLDSRLVLTAGLRYDKYSQFRRKLSPRMSAVCKLGTSGSLRAAYGEAFRIPSLAEYYYSLYYYQLKHLEWQLVPERIRTYELALSHTFEGRQLAFTLTGFRNEVPNMIMNTADRIEDQFPFMYFYYNYGKQVTSQGLELEAEKRLGAHLMVRANYTYQQARDDQGGPLVEAPDHKFNVDAVASWGRLSGDVGVNFVGPRYDQYYYSQYVDLSGNPVAHASARLDGYTLVDLRLAWAITQNLSLEVAGRNLLDASYFDKGHNGKYDTGYLSLDSKTQAYTKVNAPTDDYRNRDYLNAGRTVRVELRVRR